MDRVYEIMVDGKPSNVEGRVVSAGYACGGLPSVLSRQKFLVEVHKTRSTSAWGL
jgi:hypothetical protein